MNQVIIIGGGIIGLSSAYFLAKEGLKPIVIDDHGGKAGTSYGNAGYIGYHCIPLANPKSLVNGLRWMLNPVSPFYIQPRLDKALLRWGLRFMQSANQRHVNRSIQPLFDITRLSQEMFEEWHANPSMSFAYERQGLIDIFRSEKMFDRSIAEVDQFRDMGLDIEVLDQAGLKRVEPDVAFQAVGGIFRKNDTHGYPPEIMRALLKVLPEMGVTIVKDTVTEVVRSGSAIRTVKTRSGEYSADAVVLAAGAWSRKFASSAGLNLPLAAGRGYSITYPHQHCPLRHPIYLTERAVALTPMDGDKVRVAGTMEIVAIDTPMRYPRVKGILQSASMYLPAAQFPLPPAEEVWFGYRPCSADGMPYIGKVRSCENLILATGHSMLGFGLGPGTGKLVAELVCEQSPSVDLRPYDPNRFG